MAIDCREIQPVPRIEPWRWEVYEDSTRTVYGRGVEPEDAWMDAALRFHKKLTEIYRDLHQYVGDMT